MFEIRVIIITFFCKNQEMIEKRVIIITLVFPKLKTPEVKDVKHTSEKWTL